MISLKKLAADGLIKLTDARRKYTIDGVQRLEAIYRIPLKYLYYNNQNGRISTALQKYVSGHPEVVLNPALDDENPEYNDLFESFIFKSNEQRMKATQESISDRGQEEPGVVLDDGRAFRFECTRRFSVCKLCSLPEPGGCPPELGGIGVEPLTDKFDEEYLFRGSRSRHCAVKCLLMDNAVVAGIGNIYAAETLFAAGVDPRREAGSLTRNECGRIVREAKRILSRAIELGGSSISDFLNVDGSEGKFAQELQIYGRTGKSCLRCGGTVQCVRLGGRSSCFCPHCQK